MARFRITHWLAFTVAEPSNEVGGPSLRQERGARLRTDPPTAAGFESTVACVAACVDAGGFKKIVVPALVTLVLSVALSVPAPIHLCAPDQQNISTCGMHSSAVLHSHGEHTQTESGHIP